MRVVILASCVVGLSALVFLYYSGDHAYAPCCDTAITLMKSKLIATHGALDAQLPYNPSSTRTLYGSFISTEFPVHIVLAVLYLIDPSLIGSLEFGKIFFVSLLALAVLSYFLLSYYVYKNFIGSVLITVLLFFSFYFGSMYWLGHVAELLGMFFLPLLLYFLVKHQETERRTNLMYAYSVLAIIFFVHVLTFFLALLITLTYIFLFYIRKRNMRKKVIVLSSVFLGLTLFYFLFTPSSLNILPRFSIDNYGFSFSDMFNTTLGNPLLILFFLVGVYFVLLKKNTVLGLWFLATYFLTQSNLIGSPFFPNRFAPFLVAPIMFIVGYGVCFLMDQIRKSRVRFVAIAFLVILLLPFVLAQQQDYKKCYVRSCPGLHPTQIPESDIAAYKWIRENIPPGTVFTGAQQFGYFLPIVTENLIEFPEGEKVGIFTNKDPGVRSRLSKKYDIRYVFWGAIFEEQNFKVLGYEGFSNFAFINPYFEKVYENEGTIVYEVQ